MARSRDCRHGRQIGKCADCDLDHMEMAAEPVAWKHDCAALLTNDVELWIDACPHCGKPRNAPKTVAREPLTPEQIKGLVEDGVFFGNCKEIVRAIEAAHGITQKGGQHGTE